MYPCRRSWLIPLINTTASNKNSKINGKSTITQLIAGLILHNKFRNQVQKRMYRACKKSKTPWFECVHEYVPKVKRFGFPIFCNNIKINEITEMIK